MCNFLSAASPLVPMTIYVVSDLSYVPSLSARRSVISFP